MTKLLNSLGSTILTTRKNISIYKIKSELPEHNAINKPLQGTLMKLIEEKTAQFERTTQKAELLLDQVISLQNLPFPKREDDVVSKIQTLIDSRLPVDENLREELQVLNDDLKNYSLNLTENIGRFVRL